MDITLSLMDMLQVMGATAVPVAGYLGYIHKRVSDVPKEFVSKDDYREDQHDIKDLLREMRMDIKAILGVPPQ